MSWLLEECCYVSDAILELSAWIEVCFPEELEYIFTLIMKIVCLAVSSSPL